jgi:small subunit ribosomal protein S6
MNQYETVFILNPVLSDEQIRETVDKFTGYLESQGAKIINRENWGLRKLAYPIQKKKSGFYNFIEFTVPGEAIDNYEVELKRDERIMRFLTVRLDKYGVAYAEKRRKKVKANA